MKQKIFFCIGTQKAGTTTLHDILSQHPEVCLPDKKETHFFSKEQLFSKGENHYLSYFKPLDNYKVLGEIDPDYCFNFESADRIHQMFGKVKIVFILRNPIDRAYSHYLMTKRRGLEHLSFKEALEKEDQRITSEAGRMHYSYLSRGYYLEQIENYEKLFGAENMKIVLFDDFIKRTEIVIKDISEFIGLSEFNFDTNTRSNQASTPRYKSIQNLIYKNNGLKKFVGKMIPSKETKRKIAQQVEALNLKTSKKELLSTQQKKSLFEKYYSEHVHELESKLNTDLSIWTQ